MSKVIQTVEELDAVLHWRGKHAQAIRERDALQQRLTAANWRNDLAIDLLRRARAVVEGGGWTDLERDIAKFLKPCKPAVQLQGEPVACAHEWTDDGEFTLTCTKCGKTENHEPYGWVQTRGNAINHFTQEWDVVESWEDHGFEYKAMFDHAEQAAPVAVASRDESIAWLKRIDGIGQARAELIYSMGFRRHTDVPQS
jgi:hypothetical protein